MFNEATFKNILLPSLGRHSFKYVLSSHYSFTSGKGETHPGAKLFFGIHISFTLESYIINFTPQWNKKTPFAVKKFLENMTI